MDRTGGCTNGSEDHGHAKGTDEGEEEEGEEGSGGTVEVGHEVEREIEESSTADFGW
jgi:hypothetical protein